MAKLSQISGPVVTAKGLNAKMYDVVKVGKESLMGEVIQISGDKTTIQVYEDTSGIKPGENAETTNTPLSLELGPGLLGSIYDGIQRPLPELRKQKGDFIARGITAPGLDRTKKWEFKPAMKKGDEAKPGTIIGTTREMNTEHRIMAPNDTKTSKISEIKEGSFTVTDVICKLESGQEIRMMQNWPVRIPRPSAKKLLPNIPLITGQRIFDALFPLAKGGVAAIPGPFGSGKCVSGDTLIMVNNELKEIKEVYEAECENDKNEVEKINENESLIELNKPFKIFTFNKNKIEESVATHLYKGKTSQLTEIKTRSGRKVKITPVHKLFKVDESLNIIETEAKNLKPGEYIISPRKIRMNAAYQPLEVNFDCRICDESSIALMREIVDSYCKEKGMTKKEFSKFLGLPYHTLMNYYLERNQPTLRFMKSIFKLKNKQFKATKVKTERHSQEINVPQFFSEDFAEFLGYLSSDGMIRGGAAVVFFNNKMELLDRFSSLTERLFDLKTKEVYARTVNSVQVTSKALVKLLETLQYPLSKKSRNIGIPAILLKSPDSAIRKFLIAYISCDGHVGEKEIEITTASKKMHSGLSYLLLRLGILFSAREREINGRNYYRVFIPPKEAIKLHPYYSKEFYYNSTDIVPMNSTLFRTLLGEVKPFSLEKEGISTAGYYVDQNLTTGMFRRIQTKLDIKHLTNFSHSLDHIFCDRIVSVQTINETSDVYDITVPETHNFIGGNTPMMLHNTVSQQQLAKWADAEIIVYVGCGERGNEMTEVLEEFPKLTDPRTGKPLMNRTVLIANTSNMPVAAREASIYTGATIAEYYRDMGYSVALMADSTSRWAEAMREISSRLQEMPGEEGYPSYLSTRLAEFYERAGRVITLSGKEGSVSLIGAVSPPGGDFSEPVTQSTLRVVKAFWALDAKLAQRRHFPAINWLTSYSLYLEDLEPWFAKQIAQDWKTSITRIMSILQEEDRLMEIVQLIGSDALPEKERITLRISRMIREFLLQQNAMHPVDTYSEPKKTHMIMRTILKYADLSYEALEQGKRAQKILDTKAKDKIADVKFEKDHETLLKNIEKEMEKEFREL